MAARRKSARSQPEEDAYSSSRPSPVEGAPLPSRFTALVLTVPGIVIYTYILYTMISKLVYPGSFSPFSNAPRPPFYEGNATGGTCLSRSTTPCQRCGSCESCILKNLSFSLSLLPISFRSSTGESHSPKLWSDISFLYSTLTDGPPPSEELV